jgi:hypothetical protein
MTRSSCDVAHTVPVDTRHRRGYNGIGSVPLACKARTNDCKEVTQLLVIAETGQVKSTPIHLSGNATYRDLRLLDALTRRCRM